MNTKTTVFLALLVVVGSVLMILERPWEDVERARAEKQQAQLEGRPQHVLEDGPTEADIQRLELTVGSEPAIICERDGKDWKLTAPIDSATESYLPRQIVSRCLELKYVQKISPEEEGATSVAQAGLDSPLASVALHAGEDREPITIHFGKQAPLSTNYYASVDGDEHIYVTVEDARRTFVKGLDDFRNKKIFNFGTNEAVQVALEGGQNYEMTRGEKGRWFVEKPVRARTDIARSATLVNTIRNLRAVDFVDNEGKNLVPYGLDRPRVTVRFTTEEQKADVVETGPEAPVEGEPPASIADATPERTSHVLLIGGPAGDNYYAKLADKAWVFTVGGHVVNDIAPPLSDLRDRKLCEFTKAEVRRIELRVGPAADTLEKSDDKWILSSGKPAEPIAVDDLLKTLTDLKASSFEDEPPLIDTGLAEPRATVSVTVDAQIEPVRIAVGNPTPSGKMVYVRTGDDPAIAVLRAESVEPLLVAPVGYHDRQILNFNKEMVSEIRIERQEKSFVLSKDTTGDWRMSAPIEAKADPQSVSDILADLNHLRATSVVAGGSGAAFGLDEPWVRVALVVQSLPKPVPVEESPADDNEEADSGEGEEEQPPKIEWVDQPPQEYVLAMSAAPGGKIFARLEDGELVYEVEHMVLDHLLAELHDRTVLTVGPSSEISRLAAVYADRSIAVEKIGDKWVCSVDPLLPIDATKVTGVLDKIAALRSGGFVEYKQADLAAFGLDEPAIRLSVRTVAGESRELWVSGRGPEADPDQSRYATQAESGKVFLLSVDDMSVLNMTVSDFEKTE